MKTAAFFRVEGTLLEHGFLEVSAYLAANGQGFRERLLRLSQVAASAPLSKLASFSNRNLSNRLLAMCLKGMSKDRITVLGEEYFQDVLKDKILKEGFEIVEKAARAGHEIVLLSELVEEVIAPVRHEMNAKIHVIANRLEVDGGVVTGKLVEPVIGGYEIGSWLKKFAAEQSIDLRRSLAYAAFAPDVLLLSGVGQPCAVNPDFTLRRAARDSKWPVLEYRA